MRAREDRKTKRCQYSFESLRSSLRSSLTPRRSLRPLEDFDDVTYSLDTNEQSSIIWCKAKFCCKPEDVVAYRFDEDLWGHEGTQFHVFDCKDSSYKVRCR